MQHLIKINSNQTLTIIIVGRQVGSLINIISRLTIQINMANLIKHGHSIWPI
jgi:hypothetical protein